LHACCDEWMGEDAIEAGGRGANTVIGTYGGWLNCSQCGNCIEVCPTGTRARRHLSTSGATLGVGPDGFPLQAPIVRTAARCRWARAPASCCIVARDRYVNGIERRVPLHQRSLWSSFRGS
jgi:ferredoxin